MKICPLCHKELWYDSLVQSYGCPTQYIINFYSRSHFHDNPNIYVSLPYRIIHYVMAKEFLVSKLIERDVNGFPPHWRDLMTIKEFEIKSEQQLREKIKTILVFS